MTVSTTLTRVFLLAMAGLLSSCIDIREEYWIQGDGGGRADLRYELPTLAARMNGGESGIRRMIDRFLADTPAVTASSYEVVTAGKRTCVTLHIRFASARDLTAIVAGPSLKHLPAAASHLLGKTQVVMHGRTLDFNRQISPAKALPEAFFLPASQFAGHRLCYIMHLPAAATECNATGMLDGARTLVWDIPLEQALRTPVVTRFRTKIPIPWWFVIPLAVALGLVCGLAWLVVRNARRRRKPVGPSQP